MKTLALLALVLPTALQEEASTSTAAAPDPELLALFDYDSGVDPALDIVSIQEAGDMRVLDVTYASPMGGRVPALIFEPVSEGPHAGLIMMHGMPGSRENAHGWAPEYAKRGCVVLAISAPWARGEQEGGPPVHRSEQDRKNQIQLIQDLRRGVDLLQLLPYVDGERIGYVGGSYGAAMGGLLAGVEPRIKAFCLMMGDGGLVAHAKGEEDRVPPPGVSMERWNEWLGWMEPIEPSRWVRFAEAELLFQNGRTDKLVPAADAEAYHAAAEGTKKTVLWYESGHGVTPEVMKDQLAWLVEKLALSDGSGT